MAKKVRRKSRGESYREIIEKAGLIWDDCKVLAFAFNTPVGPEIYHFELMCSARSDYHLFDRYGNVAYIIIPKDPGIEWKCIQLAESIGGEMTTPNLQ